MQQIPNFGDQRLLGFCAYCSGQPDSRDHVPSKVFLDKPYPDNMLVVEACSECNHSFSRDEEYVACILECIIAGSTEPDKIQRASIRKKFVKESGLVARIQRSEVLTLAGEVLYAIDEPRLRNVLLKLARGHAVYEMNERLPKEPSSIAYGFIHQWEPDARERFETEPITDIFPEVACRALWRFVTNVPGLAPWIPVQDDRYRYLTCLTRHEIIVRFVIREYLACEVTWDLDSLAGWL